MLLVASLAWALAPVPARFEKTSDGWQLLRAEKPYRVLGVGGTGRMDELVAYGGNSVRTWGAENAQRDLDAAQRRGLTVCLGIWLGHKSYFDYANKDQVRKQFQDAEAIVKKHKDHPALLFWALGNEMEMNNDTPELWQAIEALAQMVKRHDPHHPVITVIAEIGGEKLANIRRYAPTLDAIGVNSYGGLVSLPKRLAERGWTKPYLVTEFGPLGPWERPKTAWKASIEPTSTEKAAFYRESYQKGIQGQPNCVGSYAFLWGDKQEATPTWFGMFLPETGEATGAVDVMSELWTGRKVAQPAPQIATLRWEGPDTVRLGAPMGARAEVKGATRLRWVIRRETDVGAYAGEGERRPDVVEGNLPTGPSIRFPAPRDPGYYRLYLYAFDGRGKAATGNLPFRVEAP